MYRKFLFSYTYSRIVFSINYLSLSVIIIIINIYKEKKYLNLFSINYISLSVIITIIIIYKEKKYLNLSSSF